MAERLTLNISLTPEQEQFVRAQVASGRFRTASEVMRESLRLLEEAEHQRVLEKWLVGGLSKAEQDALPRGMIATLQARLRDAIGKGIQDAKQGKVVPGPKALSDIRQRLSAKRLKESA